MTGTLCGAVVPMKAASRSSVGGFRHFAPRIPLCAS